MSKINVNDLFSNLINSELKLSTDHEIRQKKGKKKKETTCDAVSCKIVQWSFVMITSQPEWNITLCFKLYFVNTISQLQFIMQRWGFVIDY